MAIRPTQRRGAEYASERREDPEKAAIMRFFDATRYDVFAAGCIQDRVTGEYTDIPEAATQRDGVIWSNSDAYHFEKYDIALDEDFREYAIAHAPEA